MGCHCYQSSNEKFVMLTSPGQEIVMRRIELSLSYNSFSIAILVAMRYEAGMFAELYNHLLGG